LHIEEAYRSAGCVRTLQRPCECNSSFHVFVNFYQLIIINNCCFTQRVHWHFSRDSIAYHRF